MVYCLHADMPVFQSSDPSPFIETQCCAYTFGMMAGLESFMGAPCGEKKNLEAEHIHADWSKKA